MGSVIKEFIFKRNSSKNFSGSQSPSTWIAFQYWQMQLIHSSFLSRIEKAMLLSPLFSRKVGEDTIAKEEWLQLYRTVKWAWCSRILGPACPRVDRNHLIRQNRMEIYSSKYIWRNQSLQWHFWNTFPGHKRCHRIRCAILQLAAFNILILPFWQQHLKTAEQTWLP